MGFTRSDIVRVAEFITILMAGPVLPFQGTSVWAVVCSVAVYEADAISNQVVSSERDPRDGVSGRFYHHGFIFRRMYGAYKICLRASQTTWVANQLRKIVDGAGDSN